MYGMSSERLSRIYVKGTLRNEEDGFAFDLKNNIDSGSISGVSALIVDGKEHSLEGVTLQKGDQVREAKEISWSSPVFSSYGSVSTVRVPGALEPGEHSLTLKLRVSELGEISLPVVDTIA